ncbi:MAG TPA: GNAT family N-acetyltransferase [Armatimonadetes bacterium]|nr:GNAT family N-acetyltransferase [Armatimonadota bacterium]
MKEISVTIRRAGQQDIPVLAALFRQHLEYHAQIDERYTPAPDFDPVTLFRRCLNSSQVILLVAETAEEVVGFLFGRLLFEEPEPVTFWQWLRRRLRPRPRIFKYGHILGYISDCFVVPSARRQGIGRRLVEAALQWFREYGVEEVEIGVLPSNRAAGAFWEALGFEPFRLQMRRQP